MGKMDIKQLLLGPSASIGLFIALVLPILFQRPFHPI